MSCKFSTDISDVSASLSKLTEALPGCEWKWTKADVFYTYKEHVYKIFSLSFSV